VWTRDHNAGFPGAWEEAGDGVDGNELEETCREKKGRFRGEELELWDATTANAHRPLPQEHPARGSLF